MAGFRDMVLRTVIVGTAFAVTSAIAMPAAQASGHGRPVLLSQGDRVGASTEAADGAAANAVDGSMATAWSPAATDEEGWLTIDLGGATTVSKIVVDWGAQRPTSFSIETSLSTDPNTLWGHIWTQNLVTTDVTAHRQVFDFTGAHTPAQVVTFVRVYCESSCSIKEFKVYGTRV